jgi:hypothetical protein
MFNLEGWQLLFVGFSLGLFAASLIVNVRYRMADYGDHWRAKRKARAVSKLQKCACGHYLYEHESACPICEAPNTLYGAKTPAAPSVPLTRE